VNSLEYFKIRLESTVSPMGLAKAFKECPNDICLVDVRIGSKSLLKEKIKNAVLIPQNEIVERMSELPKEKEIWLYCWETWCSLAVQAAIPLLENGFKVKELYGGIGAWKTLNFPVESIEINDERKNTEKDI